jgi:predicted aspartyl protease
MKRRYSEAVSPPALVLTVSVSRIGQNAAEEVPAKIDTGAGISVIPNSIRDKLGCQPMGQARVKGAFEADFHIEPTYYATLDLGEGPAFPVMVISCPREDVLIGRDILNRLILSADGPNRVFELNRS